MVSSYEQFVIWSSRDGYEEYREDAGYYFYFQETGKVPKRLLAIALYLIRSSSGCSRGIPGNSLIVMLEFPSSIALDTSP